REILAMPTYVCSLAGGLVDDHQKAAIAEAITKIHNEETGAPRYFVQVVIEEKKSTDRFVGGSRASGQIWIRGDIRAGRTEVQRHAMMLRIMREVIGVKTLSNPWQGAHRRKHATNPPTIHDIHKNAPLTPKGREAMVRSVVEGGSSESVT